MRSFLRDAFVRRFVGGFALGLMALAAVQAHQLNAHPADEVAGSFAAH